MEAPILVYFGKNLPKKRPNVSKIRCFFIKLYSGLLRKNRYRDRRQAHTRTKKNWRTLHPPSGCKGRKPKGKLRENHTFYCNQYVNHFESGPLYIFIFIVLHRLLHTRDLDNSWKWYQVAFDLNSDVVKVVYVSPVFQIIALSWVRAVILAALS